MYEGPAHGGISEFSGSKYQDRVEPERMVFIDETFGRLHGEGLTILLAAVDRTGAGVGGFRHRAAGRRKPWSGAAADLAHDPQVQKVYLGTG
jgi:hypothetical protein